AHLVVQEPEDAPIGDTVAGGKIEDALPHAHRLGPLMLLLVQLLQVHERVAVPGVEPQHVLKRADRAVHEAAVPEVEAEAEQHVGVLDRREIGPLEQRLMDVDGPRHLPFHAQQVAQNHLNLERVAGRARGLGQLVDGEIDLAVHQEVQAEHVVRRFAQAAPVDPAAVAELVALPGLAHPKAREQGNEHGKEHVRGHPYETVARGSPVQNISMRQRSCRWTTPSTCCPMSTTTTAVIRRCSRMCSAAAAMVSGGTVIGLTVMISPAKRSSRCVALTMCRRRSPSVMMPLSAPSASTTQAIPSPLLEIS